jgi:hypothetical protein
MHADAIKRMVALRGGPSEIGLNGFLGRMVLWCLLGSSSELERRGKRSLHPNTDPDHSQINSGRQRLLDSRQAESFALPSPVPTH